MVVDGAVGFTQLLLVLTERGGSKSEVPKRRLLPPPSPPVLDREVETDREVERDSADAVFAVLDAPRTHRPVSCFVV